MNTSRELPSVEYKKILYTTDLSEAGRFAFPHAASIAKHYDAELTVFHVVETEEFEKYLVGYISEDLWNQIKTRNLKEARDILISRKRDSAVIKNAVDQVREHIQSEKPAVTYDVVVEMGDPVEKIIEKARAGDYDLIVMGNHGRRALKDVLMGSTAWRVLHRSDVPIMLVWLPDAEA